jgi:hypothetical protein
MTTTPVSWVTLITTSLGGLLTLLGVMITQRYTDRRERDRSDREDAARSDERTYRRLAESYLEVLRIVEREGQWIEAAITNQKIATEEVKWLDVVITNQKIAAKEVTIRHGCYEIEEAGKRVKMPPEPAVTDRATIAALLAAFGSPTVRGLYKDWRSLTTAIQTQLDTVEVTADPSSSSDYSQGIDDLKRLDELDDRFQGVVSG